ncbi:hypothetical protein SAMN05216474_0560 [Lishizhenia tianjinensis]|uniref:Pentapeptide repeat-containing protein n=1 Tax=Lishizhenia tianjinensis TaxID=477690 RepID=A0A1I6XZV9_9FLAO|nr:hypothetical protein [Lishizhenia tianjinensis]SFT43687.1 hypothetical protein SAMN05216474_0560 [Lishizhenia tianjinensis]
MKTVEKNAKWTKIINNQKFENINFEDLTVHSKRIENCVFLKVDFKQSTLGATTIYKNCKFIKCNFSGKHTSLGNPADYINCEFEDCKFEGKRIFLGSIFKNCKLSGKMKNNLLINEKRFLKKTFKFDNCDLTETEFENITFNGNRFFKACNLPRTSIRVFKNDNDELINYAVNQIATLDEETKNSLSILLHKKLRTGFNPFIIDTPFLNGFLEKKGMLEFEKIVKEFEIINS